LRERRGIPGRVARFAAATLACALFACLAFFAALSAWGLAIAPFARLGSASFVVVCALAASAVATVAAYGAFYRRRSRRDAGRRRR